MYQICKVEAKLSTCILSFYMKRLLKTYDYVIGLPCPPVRGDNPLALAIGLSYVQVDNHGSFFTTYIHVDIAYHEIFRSEVSKRGINTSTLHFVPDLSLA